MACKKPATASTDEGETRDRLKAIAFDKIKAELPPHVIDMWEQRSSGPGKRAKQTELINALMEKKGNKWEANAMQPMFEEHRCKYDESFGLQQQKGKPRAIVVTAAAVRQSS